ncbi:helix-turn-helix transcriptional regulator [Luteimonas sp. Sa2BVA3]|uniref:Helix-turn-helix transcriptional regulator n=1 Tax=Luteimonas colneyensis TaxID=2762230 RepID=A0ABR8UGY2_9GAMM|nr:helix-turn-helix transcriptional regulator [Luteimonas colneyensis]MBD7987013.1 helix-turn-helix transcriptional regulator [Luteimonas colneyensis]
MRSGVKAAGYALLRKELISARESRGLTQVELARALGRTQSFVSKYELGERRLDVLDYVLVCRHLRVDGGALLKVLEGSDAS